jgi:hypothetical protein
MDLFVSYMAVGSGPERAMCTGSNILKGRGAPKSPSDVLRVMEEISSLEGGFDKVVLSFWAELPGSKGVSNDPT